MRYRYASKKKKKSDGFVPPQNVASEAAKGLKYRDKASPSQKGGLTPAQASKHGIGSGVQRAVNLKNRDRISFKVIKQMFAFFSRHKKNKAINPKFKNEPWKDKGYVAWLLWGGDAGFAWAKKIINQVEHQEKKAAMVGTDTATIYSISPEMLYRLIQKGQWMENAESMWGDGPHNPKAWDNMTRILREGGGAYFTTGAGGDWDVQIPGSISGEGYLPPYGTDKFASISIRVANKVAPEEIIHGLGVEDLEYIRGNLIDYADAFYNASKDQFKYQLNFTAVTLVGLWHQFGDRVWPLVNYAAKVIQEQHELVSKFIMDFINHFNNLVPSKYKISDKRLSGYPSKWSKDFVSRFKNEIKSLNRNRRPYSKPEDAIRDMTTFLPSVKDQYEYVYDAVNAYAFEDAIDDSPYADPESRKIWYNMEEITSPSILQSEVDRLSQKQSHTISKLTKDLFKGM